MKAHSATHRAGWSIFSRTFSLVLASLLVAVLAAFALLMHAAARRASTELAHIVGLLSSATPDAAEALKVYDSAVAPTAPEGGNFMPDPVVQAWIANWLGVASSDVSFATNKAVHKRGGQSGDPGRRGGGIEEGPPPGEDAPATEDPSRHGPPERGRPPPRWSDDAGPPGPEPPDSDGSPDRLLAPDTLLRGEFIVAVRKPDGHWRVIDSTRRGALGQIGKQVGVLFALCVVILLPLAWWSSRALAAPIRDFAAAAEELGRDPRAAPLSTKGPREIALAAASFNIMQTRLNRMVAERTQMVGAIAHDLRTPLARLSFRLHRLPHSEQEEAQADIDDMTAMISAALAFLRDQSLAPERELLDMRSLVENVANGLSDTGQCVKLAPGASVIIRGDRIGMRRLVTNLVENALKYGSKAELRLQAEHGSCVLHIDDEGPGIPANQREQVFMPFYRGEASRNRETGGIGLGLSTAQAIAVEHGGHIELANRPAGGLRVSVILPLS